MRRLSLLFAALPALLFVPHALRAQSITPQAIEFQGAPDIPAADLLAAAHLQPGRPLTAADIRDHAQLLIDSGLFEDLHYSVSGQNLIFQLTPSTQVFPMRLINIPIAPGPALDQKLHALFPLFHGKVPADGTLLSGVRVALEQMLSAQGLEATVKAVPFTDPKQQVITFMDFSVYVPEVHLGAIHLDAPPSSPQIAIAVRDILSKLQGSPYSRQDSPGQIETSLISYYRDRGFFDCAVHATPQPAVEVPIDQIVNVIRVPFSASVTPGPLYHLSSVQLAPGLAVSPADFDRVSNLHPGDPADASLIAPALDFLTRQYHNKGYVRAKTQLTPTIDRARATVSYAVSVDPGPVYTMGRLAVENVSGQLRAMILSTWKMPAGSVFNESAIMDYFSDRKLPSDLRRTLAMATVRYVLHIDDDTKTVDVELILQKKQ